MSRFSCFVTYLSPTSLQNSPVFDTFPTAIMLVSFSGLVASLTGIYCLNVYGPRWNMERGAESLFLLACIAFPMLAFSFLSVYLNGMENSKHAVMGLTHSILGYRYLGFVITVFIVALVYWTLDEYHASFMDGVFGIDDRPLVYKDGKVVVRDVHTHPKYYNFFRILGLALNHCGGWGGIITCCIVYIGLTNYHAAVSGGDGLYHTGRGAVLLLQQLLVRTYHHHPYSSCNTSTLTSLITHPLMHYSLCSRFPLLHQLRSIPHLLPGLRSRNISWKYSFEHFIHPCCSAICVTTYRCYTTRYNNVTNNITT